MVKHVVASLLLAFSLSSFAKEKGEVKDLSKVGGGRQCCVPRSTEEGNTSNECFKCGSNQTPPVSCGDIGAGCTVWNGAGKILKGTTFNGDAAGAASGLGGLRSGRR